MMDGMCTARWPFDGDDPGTCWLLAGHEGNHEIDGGTYLWETVTVEMSTP